MSPAKPTYEQRLPDDLDKTVGCRRCGGLAEYVKSSVMDGDDVHHYKCQHEECKTGGAVICNLTSGEIEMRTGPVFRLIGSIFTQPIATIEGGVRA